MLNSKPVKLALEQVVALTDRKDKFAIYSYHENFNTLWCVDDDSGMAFYGLIASLGNNSKEDIVVIWDDIPSGTTGSVNTSLYLTPIDWAVAFSLAACKLDVKPDFRISIIDLNSDSAASAPAVRFIKEYPNRDIMSMPWIRVVRPLPPKDGNTLKERDIRDVIGALLGTPAGSNFNTLYETYAANSSQNVEVVKSIWRANLVKTSNPDDHHAIANLLGPMLLAGDNSSVSSSANVTALRYLMKEMGLFPKVEDNSLVKIQDQLKRLTDNLKNQKVKLLLLDDQWQDGWGSAICSLLSDDHKCEIDEDKVKDHASKFVEIGKDHGFVVKASSSPLWLLPKNENTIFDGDKRFKLRLDGEDDYQEIICLDLRLFSGKDTQQEADFFKKLIKIAEGKNKTADDTNKLPWPEITQDELVRVTAWVGDKENRTREDANYITALSLFPRILALTDLSIPIVVFSSTGRRDILEILKPYGNIITIFDKPRLSADIPDDIALLTKEKFIEAMEAAFKILIGRTACKVANMVREQAMLAPKFSRVGYTKSPPQHIEIYIDETGTSLNNYFTVGGLVIAYPRYKDVLDLNNELKTAGVYWYSDDCSDNTHLSKRPGSQNETYQGRSAVTTWNYTDVYSQFMSICNNLNCSVAATSVTEILGQYSNSNDRHFPIKDISCDSRYIRTLSILVELILYELIPDLFDMSHNNLSISIFPGTRISPVSLPVKEILTNKEGPTDYYGYGLQSPGKYYTIGPDSIAPLVSNVIDSRPDLSSKITIHHSRGVTLNYGVPSPTGKNKQTWDKTRIQHYFADNAIGNKSIYKNCFDVGFDTNADVDLYNLLDAQYALLNDNIPLAIELLASCKQMQDKMHGKIAFTVGSALDVLSGNNFIDICSRNINYDCQEDSDNKLISNKVVTTDIDLNEITNSTIESTTNSSNDIKLNEVIRVCEVLELTWSKRIKCKNINNENIIISENQTKKNYILFSRIKVGDRLIADIESVKNTYYARNIRRAK